MKFKIAVTAGVLALSVVVVEPVTAAAVAPSFSGDLQPEQCPEKWGHMI
ncbi:hypothetical protein [Nocardia sp. NPDC004123]